MFEQCWRASEHEPIFKHYGGPFLKCAIPSTAEFSSGNIWGEIGIFLETFQWKRFSHHLANSLSFADEEPMTHTCQVLV